MEQLGQSCSNSIKEGEFFSDDTVIQDENKENENMYLYIYILLNKVWVFSIIFSKTQYIDTDCSRSQSWFSLISAQEP